MVYSGVVAIRTQIYLTQSELEILERLESETGASRSEIIRRAIHTAHGETPRAARLALFRKSAGSWKSRTQAGAEYVDEVRGDLNKRLGELGLE